MKLIQIPKTKKNHLSWELLAKINKMTVEEYKEWYNKNFGRFNFDCRPFAEGCKCPFGLRDLENDVCYIGSSIHRCKHFMKYHFDEKGYTYIVCKCKERYRERDLF